MKSSHALKVNPVGERELVFTRMFDAPRHLVFDALTKPELIRRWLRGPEGWSMTLCTVDLRVGGAYWYVLRNDGDGTELGWGGVFREIRGPERLVHTERYDQAWYPGESVLTTVLKETGGKTALTFTILYESRTARDIALRSPMETGLAVSYDQLDEVLVAAQRVGMP